jgi:hypothetical protein
LTATEDRKLRQALHGTLQSVQQSPAPLETIIRRSKAIRLRRAGAAIGTVALAGIIAVAALALRGGPRPVVPSTASLPARPAAVGGVFATGVADGHSWRLAVQDIADPGYSCLPAITINGTDADPVYPDPENGAAVTLSSVPGTAFAFVQLPSYIGGLILNGRETLQAVAVNVCGLRYRLVGFSYPLAENYSLTVANPAPASYVVPMPVVFSWSSASTEFAQRDGIWNNVGSTSAETTTGVVADGLNSGQDWSIVLNLGAGGDCYQFTSAASARNPYITACGPVSTPDGPETILALPLSYPNLDSGGIGYALEVSPATTQLKATLSNGSTQLVNPCVIAGRRYAAFSVGASLRLTRLTWLDAAGRAFASTTALPRYGYVQFQP